MTMVAQASEFSPSYRQLLFPSEEVLAWTEAHLRWKPGVSPALLYLSHKLSPYSLFRTHSSLVTVTLRMLVHHVNTERLPELTVKDQNCPWHILL